MLAGQDFEGGDQDKVRGCHCVNLISLCKNGATMFYFHLINSVTLLLGTSFCPVG